jgi:hypothetical protein
MLFLSTFKKRLKNDQMAKPFYFVQTVSKKAKFGRFGFQKGQITTLTTKVNDFSKRM